jgi:Predicted tRNA(5-methylaminomethyl-2-thiouridylate) methyltransferase, contains the PP-loop ATPase domain
MVDQGLNAIAMHSINCFHSTEKTADLKIRLAESAKRLGAVDIVFPDITQEVIACVKGPRYGFGKNLNPCIDCRLKTVETGFAVMRERGADFVVSGEVIGQRPMSQRRDAMAIADRAIDRSGLGGLLLRPLSAKLLPTTVPEKEGWVNQNCLFSVSGRGRYTQMELAEKLQLGEYPNPAGGCLLTDAGFSGRLADLIRFKPDWEAADVELVKVGRHFLLNEKTRVVASRREEENYLLRDLSRPEDKLYINDEKNGAIVMLHGECTPENEAIAAGLAVYYSKMREDGKARVEFWRGGGPEDLDKGTVEALAVDPELLRKKEQEMKASSSVPVFDKRRKNNQ